jgi:hypothetical protein
MKSTASGGGKLGPTKAVPPHVNGPNEGAPKREKILPLHPFGKPKNRSFQATNDLDYRRYA